MGASVTIATLLAEVKMLLCRVQTPRSRCYGMCVAKVLHLHLSCCVIVNMSDAPVQPPVLEMNALYCKLVQYIFMTFLAHTHPFQHIPCIVDKLLNSY